MRHFNKSAEPASLTNFKKAKTKNWQDIHTSTHQPVYEDCLKQCLIDQQQLSGYSERPLCDAKVHIDHFVLRDFDASLTFEWQNMVADVHDNRFGADYKDRHIARTEYDKNKKQYTNLYNPITDSLEDVFTFSTNGTIHPKDITNAKAKHTIEIFNLNEASLKESRRLQMENVRTYKKAGFSNADIFEYLKTDGFWSALYFELNA